jgi:hypothetical protein
MTKLVCCRNPTSACSGLAGERASLVSCAGEPLKRSVRCFVNQFCAKFLSTMSTAKEDVEALLSKLPDDCSIEDIQYHLYVIEKVRKGLDAADIQGTIAQEQVERRLGKWLTE